MATRTMRVRARETRYIGDDYYAAGQTYRVGTERVEKYAPLGVFETLENYEPAEPEPEEPPEQEKQAEPPANKMRVRPDDKAGLPSRAGADVELSGEAANGPPRRP